MNANVSWLTGHSKLLFGCMALGILTGLYGILFGASVPFLLALPLLMLLPVLLAFDKASLFYGLLGIRAAADLSLTNTKLSFGGLGGLLNVFMLLLSLMIVTRHWTWLKKPLQWWGPTLLMTFISIFYSPTPYEAFRESLSLWTYFAVFCTTVVLVKTPSDFNRLSSVMVWASVIPSVYAVYEIAAAGGGIAGNTFRLKSTFTHANIFAFFLLLNVMLLLHRFKDMTPRKITANKLGLLAYLFLITIFLVLTKTRSAWIGALVVVFIYGIRYYRPALWACFFVPLIALMVPSIRDRVLDLTQGNEVIQYAQLNSYAWRVYLWGTALAWMNWSHMGFGYGGSSFKWYVTEFFPMAQGVHMGAHNIYLQRFFETGVVGLLCDAWLYGSLLMNFKRLFKVDESQAGIAILLILAYLIFGYSDNMYSYLAFNWYLFALLGGIYGGLQAAYRRTSGDRSDVSGGLPC